MPGCANGHYRWESNLYRRAGSFHYSDVIVSAMASQTTGVSIIYSPVCSGVDQRKQQGFASLAFVRGIHRWPVNSSHKGPVTRTLLPFHDVIMSRPILCWDIWTYLQVFSRYMIATSSIGYCSNVSIALGNWWVSDNFWLICETEITLNDHDSHDFL